MKLRPIILTLLVILAAAAARSAETLTLTQDGKTDYTVVLPENATPVQVSAATELAETLRAISGAAFPVKKESEVAAGPGAKLLVIGPSETSKSLLGDAADEAATPYDGIILKQVGSSIVFSGHPVRGPLYAVYTFLEDELGCRWWTSTESFIPKTDRIEAGDFDVVYAPKLIYRESFYAGLMGENPFSSCISLTIYSQKGSETEQFAKKYQINFEMAELVNQSTLSTDTVILGESVTVNCQVNGGARPCTYAVYYRKAGMTKWTLVQNYSEKSHVTITPKTAVNYEVRVVAKDAANTVARKDMKLTVQKPLTNTSVLGAETIRLGEKVKVRCFAEGGAGNYQFAVYYKKATSQKWTKLRGYSSQNIVMLQPAAAAVYDVMVYCKDASGKIVNKTLQLTVQAPLKNNSRLSTERITLGEKVKVRCLAEGGAGEYQYAVYYKKSTSTNWTKLRDYASGNLVIMTPKAASVYDIRVDAKDADNTVTSKTLTLTVTK